MADNLLEMNLRKAELQAIYDYLPYFGLNTEVPPIIDATGAEATEESPSEDHGGIKATPKDIAGASEETHKAGSEVRQRNDLLRHSQSKIPGTRVFRDNVKNDIDQLDKVRLTFILLL